MAIQKQAVGIDIAKDKFDVCFSVIDQQQKVTIKATRKFANTLKGLDDFDAWVKKLANAHVALVFVMEATGVYYETLAWHLHQQKCTVSVVLPNKAKRYAQSLGLKSKNDQIDAKALARMAAEQVLEEWQPLSRQLYLLRALTREIESLNHLKTQLNNQLHALQHCRIESKSTIERLQEHLSLLNSQLQEVARQVKQQVEEDAILKGKVEKITAIKGVGLVSAVTVIAETDGFALIKNQRQLVSYAGYDVVENQSGNRSARTRISKKGNSHIRRILFMPAFNVVRYKQAPFSDLYARLMGRGKKKMQAYVAVQKKLLVMMYTLWSKDETYQPQTQEKEQKGDIKTSGSIEPKLLFSPDCAADTKKIAPDQAGATQDEHPESLSPEVLFSLVQN